MCRYTFYLSVAILAFGIGLFGVFKFSWKPTEQSVTAQATEMDTVSKLEIKNDLMQFEMKDDFILRKFKEDKVDDSKEVILKNLPCKDKNLRLVWDKIKNEFANESPKYLARIGVRNCNSLFKVEKIVDLNDHGQAEIIIHQIADCTATGNCPLWVFQKKKNDYKPILYTDMIQSFKLRKTQANGYKDLDLMTHNSASSSYHQLFKFNGKKYKAQECWSADYEYLDEIRQLHQFKKPRINHEKCDEYGYVN